MNPLSLVTAPCIDWKQPRDLPQQGELHLWSWATDKPSLVPWDLDSLDAIEQERYDRFADDRVRQNFLVARAGLRRLLAGYLGSEPRDVPLETMAHGKPRLVNDLLHFNLSHSGDLVVAAVSQDEVGIDVERIRPVTSLARLAAKHMTLAEQTAIASAKPRDQLATFFRLWTRKEAIVKLTGLGLQASVRLLEVSAAAQFSGDVLLPDPWNSRLKTSWLANVAMPAGYVAAIACPQPPAAISGGRF